MSTTSMVNGSQQRPPLQPRETPLDKNVTQSTASGDSTTLNSTLHNKRSGHETGNSESENEPVKPVINKRQRTKSGSELMGTVDLSWSDSECFSNIRSDSTPFCERSFRIKSKSDDQDIDTDNSKLCFLPSDIQGKIVETINPNNLEMECKQYENHNNMHSNCGFYDIREENIETINGNHGGLSPHCAATMQYVTQLPEGCTSTVNCKKVVTKEPGHTESDDELEDDDNYLDSSEPEDNDLDSCLLPTEEEESCAEDDQSVISSITVGSTCSLRSVASETMSSIFMNENGIASNEDGSLLYCTVASSAPLKALSPSLFPHVPPSIKFCKYDETTETLPEEISKVMKWRFTTITPLIVRKSILNSGYKITKKSVMWCGTWGKHMKSPCFKGIKDYQKINHFPGTFQIGRKDKLWKNVAKLQSKFGKEEFGFIPKTFVLPGDLSTLKAAFEKEGVKKKWIVKPPASARGTGIEVINKWSQMPAGSTPAVVQRYISRPYLINNTKFDIRLYVLITSFHPLRIYLYEDGLVRFASVQYQKTSKTLSDRFMHLTNYSVNKTSSSYTHNDDAGHCQGHKWTLKTLWGYLRVQDVDTGALWSKIADIVIKTIIAGENEAVFRTKKFTKSLYTCFELFGFDVILDEKLRPWLLEVNISPSLHSASSLDHSVKGPLIADLLNLVSYHIPDKITHEKQGELLKELNLGPKVTSLCLDRRLYTRLLTTEEQAKHVEMNSLPRNQYLTTILENLQPDDVRHLLIAEDQMQRAGKFACIFPTADTHHYFGFLSKTRYYNRLMDAWENAYRDCKSKGIELLEELCEKKVHLKVTPRFKLPKVVEKEGASNTQNSVPRRRTQSSGGRESDEFDNCSCCESGTPSKEIPLPQVLPESRHCQERVEGATSPGLPHTPSDLPHVTGEANDDTTTTTTTTTSTITSCDGTSIVFATTNPAPSSSTFNCSRST